AGDAAVGLGGEGGGAAGKTGDGTQLLHGEGLGGLVQAEELAHGAAAEDIPGGGGVHHMDAGGGRYLAAALGVGNVAARVAEAAQQAKRVTARSSSTVRASGALFRRRNWLMALPPKISPAPVVSTTWMPEGEATSQLPWALATWQPLGPRVA